MWRHKSLGLALCSLGLTATKAGPTILTDRPIARAEEPNPPRPITLPIKIINSYYTIPLSLGTPPQPLDFFFDTGSGPLWALNPLCAATCPSTYNFTRSNYNPNASNTSSPQWLRLTVEYLGKSKLFLACTTPESNSQSHTGGSVSGNVWSEKLTIQNTSAPVLQRVISTTTSTWAAMAAGGFVGLGFKPLALGNTSIYDALFHPELLPDHRTGIYLGSVNTNTSNPSPATNGVVTFGGSEEETYGSEPLKWLDIAPVGPPSPDLYAHWVVPITGIEAKGSGLNGSTTTTFPTEGSRAVFDTGAALINVPASIIESLYTTLGFNWTAISSGRRPLCSEVLALNSSLTLSFGTVNITVTTTDLAKPGYNGDQYCWPPFNPWNSPGWLIGMNFLKSFYTVWDLGGWNVSTVHDGQPRLGFSYLKHEYRPSISG